MYLECPECESRENITTERRPDGDSMCMPCGHKDKTALFQKKYATTTPPAINSNKPMSDKCFEPECCCNCGLRVDIYKHPWNTGKAKGRISEQFGWGCTALGVTIFSDREHGTCEMCKPIK